MATLNPLASSGGGDEAEVELNDAYAVRDSIDEQQLVHRKSSKKISEQKSVQEIAEIPALLKEPFRIVAKCIDNKLQLSNRN